MPRGGQNFKDMPEEELRRVEEQRDYYRDQAREASTKANLDRWQRYHVELCERRRTQPWPANPEDVATLMTAFVERVKSAASLDQLVSAIRVGQRERGHPEWTKGQNDYLGMVKRGLLKTYRAPVRRKLPITVQHLRKMVSGLDRTDLAPRQYRAMMFLAHDACLRTKELLELRWSDIRWTLDTEQRIVALKVRLRVSKARYTEAPEELEIHPYLLDGEELCGTQLLWEYMTDLRAQARTKMDQEAYLFPNMRTGSGSMPRSAFVSWVHARLTSTGHEASFYGGHSFRAGGATDMHEGNAPEKVARMLGRWRSRETYLIYIRLDPSKRAADVSKAFSEAYALQSGASMAT